MMTKEMAKSLPVSKRMVYDSYLKVMEKKGSAGIDKVSIEAFNKNLSFRSWCCPKSKFPRSAVAGLHLCLSSKMVP
jgi:hypothetical protein